MPIVSINDHRTKADLEIRPQLSLFNAVLEVVILKKKKLNKTTTVNNKMKKKTLKLFSSITKMLLVFNVKKPCA